MEIEHDIQDVANSWDREYERQRYVGEAPVPFVDDVLQAADVEGLRGAAGLYVGCGNGRNLVPLVEGGLDLIGLDVSPAAIQQLGERLPNRRAKLIVGTADDLEPGVTFPVVIGIQVFQHGTRQEAHRHLMAAQARTAPGGLFCIRVNSAGTEVWPAYEVVESDPDGGFTVRYLAGSKTGLDVHFYSERELSDLFADEFEPVMPLRADTQPRAGDTEGHWQQWEGIWRKKPGPLA